LCRVLCCDSSVCGQRRNVGQALRHCLRVVRVERPTLDCHTESELDALDYPKTSGYAPGQSPADAAFFASDAGDGETDLSWLGEALEIDSVIVNSTAMSVHLTPKSGGRMPRLGSADARFLVPMQAATRGESFRPQQQALPTGRQGVRRDAQPAPRAALHFVRPRSRQTQRGAARAHASHGSGSSSTEPSGRLIASPQRLEV
jgi:hypothetical protein